MRRLILTFAMTVAAASPALAQGSGCEDASARITGAALPRVGAREWADWMTLTGCGSRGAAVVAGALQSDAVRTEGELGRLDHLASLLDGWFQPSLVRAYESLIVAPDASAAVRLRAMWLLSGLLAPDVDVASPLQGYVASRCERYGRATAIRDLVGTVPSSVYDQARDAMARLGNEGAQPEYVRTTARCWSDVVSDALTRADQVTAPRNDQPTIFSQSQQPVVVSPPSQQPVVVSPQNPDVVVSPPNPDVVVVQSSPTIVVEAPIRVVYECDNRFIFYNDAGYDLAVRWGGYGPGGVLRVAHGGPYVWTAGRFGPLHFWMGEQELVYGTAVYRPCGHRAVIFASAIYPWYGWHSGLGMYYGGWRHAMGPAYPPRPARPIYVVPPHRRPEPRPEGHDGNRFRDTPRYAPSYVPPVRTVPEVGRAVPATMPRVSPPSPRQVQQEVRTMPARSGGESHRGGEGRVSVPKGGGEAKGGSQGGGHHKG